MRPHPETMSRSKPEFRDALSAEGLNRKPHPILSIKSGMDFPPETSTEYAIPKTKKAPGRQKP